MPHSTLDQQWTDLEQVDLGLYHFVKANEEVCKTYEDEYLILHKAGIQILCYGDILYPANFYFMKDPPLVLTMMGKPCWLGNPAIAVVGSREPTEKSLLWIQNELSLFAKNHRVVWVSGGARGVDQAIHRMAVQKNSSTVVVLPSGILNIYPSQLQNYIEPILNTEGCFISEYTSHQRVSKYLFHHRNRLIAALSIFTLIVEAKLKSGTMMTAHLALEDGRPVLVVPGHPTDPYFQGNLQLMYDGGQIVRTAQDIEEIFRSELRQSYFEKLLIVND